MTTIDPDKVNWSTLSGQSRSTLQTIVSRLEAGWSAHDIEEQLGWKPGTVARRMSDLRRDIRRQQEESTS